MPPENSGPTSEGDSHLEGQVVGLRRAYASSEEVAAYWVPWAERNGVRRLITITGLELWPERDPKVDQANR